MVTMRMMLPCICIIVSLLFPTSLHSFMTLSTNNRWIIDTTSHRRIKLRCVNWAGHMEAMIPEGLDKQSIASIADKINFLGFNCVRLTWATYMYTQPTTLKVEELLTSLNLLTARDGIRKHNPDILAMTNWDAHAAVVKALELRGLMILLDNHVSKPQWCCSTEDGNGWFGDQFFDPYEWLKGLEIVAAGYKGNRMVLGMSLRNELRGRNDMQAWHNYMQQGADVIHNANPDLLVIVSGINYDSDLSFLRDPSLRINLPNKLVYEVHRYAWTLDGLDWVNEPLNQVCGRFIKQFDDSAGFLMNSGQDSVPLLVSEFGVDQSGANEADNRFLSCMLSQLAELDLDFALWAIQGSYYTRSGQVGVEEMYGVLDDTWSYSRNLHFRWNYQLPLMTNQDPSSHHTWYSALYHIQTGNCVHIGRFNKIILGNCNGRTQWNYDLQDGHIRLEGDRSQCLKVNSEGQPITISNNCSSPESSWSILADSMLHIGAKDGQGNKLCMDVGPSHTVVSIKCICVDGSDINCHDDPRNQWFKLIYSNRLQ